MKLSNIYQKLTVSINSDRDHSYTFDKRLRSFLRNQRKDMFKLVYKEMINENIAGFVLMVLPIVVEKARILYIGHTKMGVINCLAAKGHKVFVCDTNENKLRLISKRNAIGKNTSIFCIRSNSFNLCFKNEQFDMIIIEFESFDMEYNDERNEEFEIKKFRMGAKSLLKDKGNSLILIGNWLSLFRLVKKLKNCFTFSGYSNGLSLLTIKRPFKYSLLKSIASYGVEPETGNFSLLNNSRWISPAYIPLQNLNSFPSKSIKWKIKTSILRNQLLTTSYGIVNTKKSSSITLDIVLKTAFEELKKNTSIKFKEPVVKNILNRKTQRIIIHIAEKYNINKSVLLKIPYGEITRKGEIKNYRSLVQIHSCKHISKEIKNRVPIPIFNNVINNLDVFIESCFNNCYPLKKGNNTEIIQEALQFILLFNQQTLNVNKINSHLYKKLIDRPINAIDEFCYKDRHIKGLDILKRYAKNELFDKEIPLVFVHGDYSVGNLLVKKNSMKLSGVVDWELSDNIGLPVLDLLFLLKYTEGIGKKSHLDLLLELIRNPKKSIKNNLFLYESFNSFSLKVDILPCLVILHWATQIASRGLNVRKKYDINWIENNILRFLEKCTEIFQ